MVPGGRFREVFGTLLHHISPYGGGQRQRVRAHSTSTYLIDRLRAHSNDSRSCYHLGRSPETAVRPPWWTSRPRLREATYRRYLPQLQKELAYWIVMGCFTQGRRLHVKQ